MGEYILTCHSTVLQTELETAMRLLGAHNVEELGPQHVSIYLRNVSVDADRLTIYRSTPERWSSKYTMVLPGLRN